MAYYKAMSPYLPGGTGVIYGNRIVRLDRDLEVGTSRVEEVFNGIVFISSLTKIFQLVFLISMSVVAQRHKQDRHHLITIHSNNEFLLDALTIANDHYS